MPGVLYISAELPKTFVSMKASKLYEAYRVFFFFLTALHRKCASVLANLFV